MAVAEEQSAFRPDQAKPGPYGTEKGLGSFGAVSRRAYNVSEGSSARAVRSQINGIASMLKDLKVNNDPKGALEHFFDGEERARKVVARAADYGPLDRIALGAKPKATPVEKGAQTAQRAIGRQQQPATNTEDSRRRMAALPQRGQPGLLEQAVRAGTKAATQGAQRVAAQELRKAAAKTQQTGVPEYVPPEYRALIANSAKQYGVPVDLLSAMLQQESGFAEDVIRGTRTSSAGAQGIAQFMPETAKGMGVNPLDPNSAVPGAAKYLRDNYDQFGSWELALAAYNAGGGAVSQYGGIPPFPETQNYVATIMANLGGKPAQRKPIPRATKEQARELLGKARTRQILSGKPTREVSGQPVTGPLPGPWGGSQAVIKELIGPKYAAKVDWKDKEDRGYDSLHDINASPNGFAADLMIDEGGLDTEKLVDRIGKKLGLDPGEVNYGTTGLESGITYKGYNIEFLPYDHGSGPHVHIGAEWAGKSAGTSTGGVAPSGGGASWSGGMGGTSTTASPGSASPIGTGSEKGRSARRGFPAVSPIRSPLAARAVTPSMPGQPDEEEEIARTFREAFRPR